MCARVIAETWRIARDPLRVPRAPLRDAATAVSTLCDSDEPTISDWPRSAKVVYGNLTAARYYLQDGVGGRAGDAGRMASEATALPLIHRRRAHEQLRLGAPL